MKRTKQQQIDRCVTNAMLVAGDGGPVSVLETAHVLKRDPTFLKLIGVKAPCGIFKDFEQVVNAVRKSMVHQYGPLRRVR